MHLVLDTHGRREVPDVKPTLVYAAGSRLRGDDGAGPAVIDRLAQEDFGPSVELIDGGVASLDAALVFQERKRIILIDTADLAAAPGTVRRLVLATQQLVSRALHPTSLHSAGLFESLALAAALGTVPSRIILFAIQPRCMQFEIGLSTEALAAVARVVDAVREELERTDDP